MNDYQQSKAAPRICGTCAYFIDGADTTTGRPVCGWRTGGFKQVEQSTKGCRRHRLASK